MMTDEMLTQAAGELAYAMNNSLPEPGECNHQFSNGFERKMKRLMRRADHPGIYSVFRAVASIVLVISIGFASLLALSPEARAAVFGWVRRQYESFFEYHFEGTTEVAGEARYIPQWIPDGYELSSVDELADGEMYTYYDDSGRWVVFSYLNASDGNKLYADSPGYDEYDIEINENPGKVYISYNPEETNLIVWTDLESEALLYITGLLDKNTLITFAENVIRQNSDTDLKKYYPTWVPDDCEFVTSHNLVSGESFIYTSGRGMLVQFTYIFEQGNGMLSFDGVQYERQSVRINGNMGEIGIAPNDAETNYIVWTDPTTNALFLISGDYDERTLIKMAENFTEKK